MASLSSRQRRAKQVAERESRRKEQLRKRIAEKRGSIAESEQEIARGQKIIAEREEEIARLDREMYLMIQDAGLGTFVGGITEAVGETLERRGQLVRRDAERMYVHKDDVESARQAVCDAFELGPKDASVSYVFERMLRASLDEEAPALLSRLGRAVANYVIVAAEDDGSLGSKAEALRAFTSRVALGKLLDELRITRLQDDQIVEIALLMEEQRLREVRDLKLIAGRNTGKLGEVVARIRQARATGLAVVRSKKHPEAARASAWESLVSMIGAGDSAFALHRGELGLPTEETLDEEKARCRDVMRRWRSGSASMVGAIDEITSVLVSNPITQTGYLSVPPGELHSAPAAHTMLHGATIGTHRAFSGMAASWEDADLMSLGQRLWYDSYRLLDEQPSVHRIGQAVEQLYASASTTKRASAVAIAQFAALWAHDAFQKVITTHTYGATLMCSDASHATLEDLPLPWRAFMVAVPDGLLAFTSSSGQQVEYRRILVRVSPGQASMVLYDPASGAGGAESAIVTQGAPNIGELLFDEAFEGTSDLVDRIPSNAPEMRALKLAKRLVTGLLMTMAYTNNFRSSKPSPPRTAGSGREPGEGPEHRTTFVGKPLKIDLRAKVASYLNAAGGNGRANARMPSVQVLVRGHFKRQVIGVGRKGRKVIHVLPYWKGDRDAPILTKPRMVVG